MKPEPNKNMTTMSEHRRNTMSARDIQDEIRLIRLAYRERQVQDHRKDLRFIAFFCLVMALGGTAAAILYFQP